MREEPRTEVHTLALCAIGNRRRFYFSLWPLSQYSSLASGYGGVDLGVFGEVRVIAGDEGNGTSLHITCDIVRRWRSR